MVRFAAPSTMARNSDDNTGSSALATRPTNEQPIGASSRTTCACDNGRKSAPRYAAAIRRGSVTDTSLTHAATSGRSAT